MFKTKLHEADLRHILTSSDGKLQLTKSSLNMYSRTCHVKNQFSAYYLLLREAIIASLRLNNQKLSLELEEFLPSVIWGDLDSASKIRMFSETF